MTNIAVSIVYQDSIFFLLEDEIVSAYLNFMGKFRLTTQGHPTDRLFWRPINDSDIRFGKCHLELS